MITIYECRHVSYNGSHDLSPKRVSRCFPRSFLFSVCRAFFVYFLPISWGRSLAGKSVFTKADRRSPFRKWFFTCSVGQFLAMLSSFLLCWTLLYPLNLFSWALWAEESPTVMLKCHVLLQTAHGSGYPDASAPAASLRVFSRLIWCNYLFQFTQGPGFSYCVLKVNTTSMFPSFCHISDLIK